MPKQKTPDDIQTNIGYTQPEISWLGHPREHGFYAERGGTIVSDYYPSIFDVVLAYPDGMITDNALRQLSEGEKRALAKPRMTEFPQTGAENLVCISEKFHTHPKYHDFYENYCDAIHGFIGCYDLIIRMAEALTDWEENKGGKELYDRTEVIWDDLVDAYVDKYFEISLAEACNTLPDVKNVFEVIEPRKDSAPNRPAGIILPDALEP